MTNHHRSTTVGFFALPHTHKYFLRLFLITTSLLCLICLFRHHSHRSQTADGPIVLFYLCEFTEVSGHLSITQASHVVSLTELAAKRLKKKNKA